MLLQWYKIELENYPTATQIEVLRRYGVTVEDNAQRRNFRTRLIEQDARRLKAENSQWVRAVSCSDEEDWI